MYAKPGEAERKRLEDFKIWFYRRMLKIKWVDRITIQTSWGKVDDRRTFRYEVVLRDSTYPGG